MFFPMAPLKWVWGQKTESNCSSEIDAFLAQSVQMKQICVINVVVNIIFPKNIDLPVNSVARIFLYSCGKHFSMEKMLSLASSQLPGSDDSISGFLFRYDIDTIYRKYCDIDIDISKMMSM